MTTELERLARIIEAQRRDYRGRYLRKLKPTPDGSREWLIWSKYHSAWHCRSESGGACGYTYDIANAGVFDRAKAAAYNDDRNKPFHVTEVRGKIDSAIERHTAKLARLHALRDYQASELQRCSWCKSGPWHVSQLESNGLCPDCTGGY